MSTQVILLERVDSLGALGDVVTVKPGFARNYLLPQRKALRATKENVAYFEAQKKHIENENANKKTAAEKLAKKIDSLKVPLIRAASESGQMYGSVTSRDIAVQIAQTSSKTITRKMVAVNRSFKTIGLDPIDVALHPEVTVSVTINIARTPEEAEIQAELGRALISGYEDDTPAATPTSENEGDDAADDATANADDAAQIEDAA